MSNNINLNNANKVKNDEYYTIRADVNAIMDSIINYYHKVNIPIDQVMFIFPADTSDSEFVKYAISHNLVYNNFLCIGKENWIIGLNPMGQYCIVTNPPFSKLNYYFTNFIFDYVGFPNIQYTFIVPPLIISTEWYFSRFAKVFNYYPKFIKSLFETPAGDMININSMVISTIPNLTDKHLEPSHEEEPPLDIQEKKNNYVQKIRYFYWMVNHNKFEVGDEVKLSCNSITFNTWLNQQGWDLQKKNPSNKRNEGEFAFLVWKKIR